MRSRNESQRQDNFLSVCSRCKTSYSCCFGTRPPVTEERRKIIEEYLKKEEIPIMNAFVEEEYVFPRENPEGYCVFHNMTTRKCLIHAVKPETCVAGPITFDANKKTGEIELFIKMEKICSLARVVYDDKKKLRNHLESAKKEIMRLIAELGQKELQAILLKDEPETFRID